MLKWISDDVWQQLTLIAAFCWRQLFEYYYHYAHINILDKPSTAVISNNGQIIPKEGSSYSLSCHVLGGRPDAYPHLYTWLRNNTVLDEHSNIINFFLNHSEHDGIYRCSASNTVGQGEHSAGYELKVHGEYGYLVYMAKDKYSENLSTMKGLLITNKMSMVCSAPVKKQKDGGPSQRKDLSDFE